MEPNEHRERVAIVTGGGSGIGAAVADRLTAEGARVTVFDVASRRAPAAESASSPSAAAVLPIDVSREDEVARGFKAVVERGGRIDYVVCCAAIFHAHPFLELSADEWRRTIDVNLNGSFLCCREALRCMRPRRFGRIVLFSSMLARTGGKHSAHYCAS